MQLTGSVPVLACSNIDDTLLFYQQALQFVIVNKRMSGDRLEWVYLRSGEVSLMLEAVASADTADDHDSRIYFYTDDVQRLHHYMKARAYPLSELRLTGYGMQEFDVRDPDHHAITIGQHVTEK